MVLFLLLLFCFCCNVASSGEIPYRAVRLTATTVSTPRPAIHLRWNADSTAQRYIISRKSPNATGWDGLAAIEKDTIYTDTTIEITKEYEYQIVKAGVRGGLEYSTAGYCSAGAEIPFEEVRGTVALVIDSVMIAAVPEEISTLEQDLQADGWHVRQIVVGRAETFDGKKVRAVKREIQRLYDEDRQLRAVILLGRIPVPYSGKFVVDDHDEHLGAWPADCYYADVSPAPLDERWSDLFALQTTASRVENQNRRVDGKFDQSELPSDAELSVGRIDFWNLPAAGKTEIDMMRAYLQRNHAYRLGNMSVRNAACFWDNFDVLGEEMFAQSARSNAASLFGNAEVFEENWMGISSDSTFQFGFAAGPGSYTGCGDVGDAQSAARGTNAIFGSLIGSYFGDWDNSDNFLRSALGGNHTLAVWWSGRPQWQLHRCGAGQPIGTAAVMSLNNDGTLYQAGRYTRGVHIALLGDPTLRFFPVPPPQNIAATVTTDSIVLRWNAPAGAIAGYAVYRDDGNGFRRLNPTLSPVTSYTEPKPASYSTNTRYMVRAVRLQITASCSFYNPSQGIIAKPKPQSADEVALINEELAIEPLPVESGCEMRLKGVPRGYSVQILDVFGRTIATPQQVGFNYWHWNAAGTVAGMYVVRATSESNIISRLVVKR